MARQISYVTINVAEIDGKKFAVVPLAEYEAFVREHRVKAKQVRPRPSAIEQRPDLLAYLTEVLGTKPLNQIVADCRERFGPDLPSLNAFHRHWQKVRRAQAEESVDGADARGMTMLERARRLQTQFASRHARGRTNHD